MGVYLVRECGCALCVGVWVCIWCVDVGLHLVCECGGALRV